MERAHRAGVLVVHSSDEMYGADRMVLEVVSALTEHVREAVTTWVPTDVAASGARLSDELVKSGHEVEQRDLPVLRRSVLRPRAVPLLLRRLVRLVRVIRLLRPRVVYCTTSACLLVAVAARLAGCRRVVLHNQEMWRPRESMVLGGLALLCERVLCISGPVKDAMPWFSRRRATVLINGVPDRGGYRLVPADGQRLTFVVASRWNAWKGHLTLLHAWEAADGPGRLVVLGGPPTSGEGVDVAAVVSQMRTHDSVQVVGEVDDITPYLDESDVVIMPSDEPEPFGLVAIEAFARGRPVLGTAGGGLADVVEPEVTGWLVSRGDWRAMAERLATLDRAQVVRASKMARQAYENSFSSQRFRQDLSAFWRREML